MRKSKAFVLSLALLLIFQLAIPGLNYSAYAADSNFITFKYDAFSNDGRFKTNGNTSFVDGKLRLTRAAVQQWGTAFNTDRVSLKNDRSFSTYFTFQLTSGGGYDVGWADGIVFTVQTYSNAAGTAGGGMGYQGIQQSVGVEFDTWNNGAPGDPDANHIGINFNGSIASSSTKSLSTSTLNMKSGTIHAWVDYDGVNKKIEVRVNKNSNVRPTEATLSQSNVNLSSILASNDVYVGFTAATGSAYQNHDITKWYFVNDYAPIDVTKHTYLQAPTSYDVTTTELDDGSVKLVITAKGGTQQDDIPLEVTATNGAIVEPASVTTDEDGKAEVIVSSPSGTIVSTVKVEGPGGIYKDTVVNIPGRTAAPKAGDILANATDGEVTVSNVPEHVTVSIYDHEGKEIISKSDVTGGTVTFTDINDLSIDKDIQVTYTAKNQNKSNKTTVRPKARSEVIHVKDMISNGTKNIVYVDDVVSGATIRVYDHESGLIIGQAVADGSINPLAISIEGELVDLQLVDVTIQQSHELESYPTTVSTILETSDKPVKVEADASTDIITVKQVPDGAKVIIYDKDGDEIASVYNRTGASNDMIIDMFPPGIELGDQFEVSIIEVKKYESDSVNAVGQVRSSVLPSDNIIANGSTNEVKVSDVPAGATINVYDEHGEKLGQATNDSVLDGEVTIVITEGLTEGQEIYVTQEENGKLESEATKAIAFLEQSSVLEEVAANATKDTVTVTKVPSGATINVYAEDGITLIGTASNDGTEADTVIVTIDAPGLNAGDIVQVTITEKDKLESEPVSATATIESASLNEEDITANGTAGTVTVKDVPAGATIIVYDENGKELGRLTQGEEDGDLTIIDLTEMGETISVSIALEGELASEPIVKVVTYEQSAALTTDVVDVNATNHSVTVVNVPAGATITVYAEDGITTIGTATNEGNKAATIVVTIDAPGLYQGDQVKVTIREQYKTESEALEATAEYEQGEPLDEIAVNATKDTVTVTNVPAGATVTVYAEDGTTKIGTATNDGNDTGTVVVVIDAPGLNEGDIVHITITEKDKLESELVSETAKVESASLNEEDITADGTSGTVTVKDVPAGATIIVYDKNGKELGRLTQGEEDGDLTLTNLTGLGENIAVSIALEGELASEPVVKAVTYEQSSALNAEDVSVNATKDSVTVVNVPAGATITVYAEDGITKIGSATNEGNEPDTVVVTIDAPGMSQGDQVKVTILEPHKTESDVLEATAEQEQGEPLDEIAVNATKDTVTVTNVPAGATVTVYAEDGTTKIGTATNEGNDTDTVVVKVDEPGLNEGDIVHITITEKDKLESELIPGTAKVESASLNEENITADGTSGTVTVKDVPAGATIIVYDENGKEIGRLTQGEEDGDLTLTSLTGLGENIVVSIALEGELASEPVVKAVTYEQSTALNAEDVSVNATKDTVTVVNVPVGATVIVYAEDGITKIGTATNEGNEPDTVVVTIDAPGLNQGDQVKVTIREQHKAESDALEATAEQEQGASLNDTDVAVNATKDIVTVTNVPAGATVTVYAEDGTTKIGTATNEGNEAGTVVVTIDAPGLNEGDIVKVTISEKDKLESEGIASPAKVVSASLAANQIVANATSDTVSLTTIPAGAEVKIYRANGELIGSMVNTSAEAADLLISIHTPGIASSEILRVSITEVGKLESEVTTVTATFLQTIAPTLDQLVANATNDRIYIQDAPAGATVKVYDLSGNLLMSRKNTTSGPSDLVLTMIPGFVAGNQFEISFTQVNHLESTKTAVTAYDQSKALTIPQVKDINVSKDTIVLQDIPAGAMVIAYDAHGNEIGRATNNSGVSGEVTITGELISSTITFTIIEAGKLKSESVTIDLELTTLEQINDALRRLSIGFQAQDTWESVTLDVFLLTTGAHETDVAWSSSKPETVNIENPTNGTIEATVVRKDSNESVILTAVVSKNGISKSKTFLIIVKSSDLTKEENPAYRTVDVAGGESNDYRLPLNVNRITMSDGSKIDKAIFDAASAASFINEPITQNSPARVIVDEFAADQADEYAIEIPQQSVNSLFENGNSVEIVTDYGQLKISSAVLAQMNENFLDLFFRIVPVKSEAKQEQLNSQLVRDAAVRKEAGNRKVVVLGSSLEVETNYSNYETTLFIPFAKNGIVVPSSNVDRFLDSLRIFIEHSDGEKVVSTGTVIYEAGVPIGLAIEISKFSTFTIFQLQAATNSNLPPVDDETETEPTEEKPSEIAHHTGYISGYEDGTFRAEQSIKRSEMAAILFRVNDLEKQNSFNQLYPDVSTSHWAAAYIERLHELDWMIGDVNGNFRPESGITRAEMAIILSRWLELPLDSSGASPFSDVADNHWASEAIAAVYKAGYMIGYEGNTFNPKQYLTRAEAVTIINRVLNRGPLTNVPTPTWKDVSPDHWAYGEIEEASRDHFYVKVDGERSEQYVAQK